MSNRVKTTERGWIGHFIGGHNCLFRRNTLIECGDERIVVSTVGAYMPKSLGKIETIGVDRWFETMAFKAEYLGGYWDADVDEPVGFNSKWEMCAKTIDELNEKYPNPDTVANDMHDSVVAELVTRMEGK